MYKANRTVKPFEFATCGKLSSHSRNIANLNFSQVEGVSKIEQPIYPRAYFSRVRCHMLSLDHRSDQASLKPSQIMLQILGSSQFG